MVERLLFPAVSGPVGRLFLAWFGPSFSGTFNFSAFPECIIIIGNWTTASKCAAYFFCSATIVLFTFF